MVPLGLGLSIDSIVSSEAAAAIEDYVFDLVSGELTPRDAIAYDYSDTWDVTSTEISPAASPAEEGYFDIDGNGDIQPKA